jgi:hypothetical protein
MSRHLERYQNSATQGLNSAERRELRDELRTHILERSRKHEFEGLHPDDAIRESLRELGKPERIALPIIQRQLFRHASPLLLGGLICAVFGVTPPLSMTVTSRAPSRPIGAVVRTIPLATPDIARVVRLPLARNGAVVVAPIPLARDNSSKGQR